MCIIKKKNLRKKKIKKQTNLAHTIFGKAIAAGRDINIYFKEQKNKISFRIEFLGAWLLIGFLFSFLISHYQFAYILPYVYLIEFSLVLINLCVDLILLDNSEHSLFVWILYPFIYLIQFLLIVIRLFLKAIRSIFKVIGFVFNLVSFVFTIIFNGIKLLSIAIKNPFVFILFIVIIFFLII